MEIVNGIYSWRNLISFTRDFATVTVYMFLVTWTHHWITLESNPNEVYITCALICIYMTKVTLMVRKCETIINECNRTSQAFRIHQQELSAIDNFSWYRMHWMFQFNAEDLFSIDMTLIFAVNMF